MQDDPQRALQLATPQWTASSEGQAWQTRMAALFKGRSWSCRTSLPTAGKTTRARFAWPNLKLKSRETGAALVAAPVLAQGGQGLAAVLRRSAKPGLIALRTGS
ncbi:hypothetical protein [Comamonas sp. JC664]|uniref:hypothetical protein n=1 Tax=Comamonas sp. JC664 TaxID=2801917 RepID=UPI003610B99F